MLLDFKELVKKYNLKFKKVVLIGAHFGEEYDVLMETGAEQIVMIEPCKKAFEVLSRKFGSLSWVTLVNCACGEIESTGTMYTGDNTINKGQSNSLLQPTLHLVIHPEVEFPDKEDVEIKRLDDILGEIVGFKPELIIMDAQGYEGYILRGATTTLQTVNSLYTEINFMSVYEGATLADELDSLLSDFYRVETGAKVGGAWSDCLFIRR